MEIANAHLVVFSPCGGTAKVAQALARDIPLPVREHAISRPRMAGKELAFEASDLVFLAFPVYGGRMPRNIGDIFARLKGANTPCALVAVYGNREFEGALLDLHECALASGFKPVAAVAAVAEHSMAPQVATGRPDGEDCQRLAAYGLKVLEAARAGAELETAPGAYPAWKMPPGAHLFPLTDEGRCVVCGQCAEVCPVGAIDAAAPADTDIEKCIVCAACVKYCPNEARAMGTPETRKKFEPHLLTAAARRKDAEIFF